MTARSPYTARYRGMAHLTEENMFFLAALCRKYRATHCLTRSEAGARAATNPQQWWNVENMIDVAGTIKPTSPIRRIISLVLHVSPVCRKGESPHNRPTLGVSHVEKEQVEAVHR